jgi:hypothetical protein
LLFGQDVSIIHNPLSRSFPMLDSNDNAIRAFLSAYPQQDVALKEATNDSSLGWWVWENGQHVRYGLRELREVWGDMNVVADFVSSMTHVKASFLEIYTASRQ